MLLILWLAPAQTHPQNQPIRQHLSYLASDELKGRFPGSEGDSLARVYIINHFRENGLQPPFVNGEYTQRFSTLFQKRVIETNKISVVSKKSQQPLLFGEDYALLDKCGSAEFSGEVAFIGFGIHDPESGYDDYSKLNLKNKIVIGYWYPSKDMHPEISKLVWKYHISEKAEMIHASGGKCAIFVLPGSFPKKDKIFRFTLPQTAPVRLSIFNNPGQLVREFQPGLQLSGNHTLQWDGRNQAGQQWRRELIFISFRPGRCGRRGRCCWCSERVGNTEFNRIKLRANKQAVKG